MSFEQTRVSIPQALQIASQYSRARQFPQAMEIYRQILQVDPRQCKAMHMLGLIEVNCGRPAVAEQWFRQGLVINPGDPELRMDLGNVLLMQRRLTESVVEYRQVIAAWPQVAATYSNMGIALSELEQTDEAIAALQKAAELAPNESANFSNLGNALKRTGRLTAAIAAFSRGIELLPSAGDIHNNLANAFKDAGQIAQAIAMARKSVQLSPGRAIVHSNLLLFLHFDPSARAQAIYDDHQQWNRLHAVPLLGSATLSHDNDRSPDRRLRVGYVSADMRDHAVACFFESLLANHDHQQVETFCYTDFPEQDHVTVRLQKQANHWQKIFGQPDEDVAKLMRSHRIDILVDLSGHTAGNRLLVFARKPAPIQITYLGYPDTTGLTAIDYRITDPLADPPGTTEQFHSEQLLRLPQTFLCYRPPDHAPAAVSTLPAMRNGGGGGGGGGGGAITFGSFNILSKINPPLVEVWAGVLRSCPGSKMLIKSGGLDDPGARNYLLGLFAQQGIRPDRLDVRGKIARQADHMKLYDEMDIALDTFPYHGTTTTCEALWMGVPVITLAGTTHVSRVGVSLLNTIGLADLVAQTPEEYVQIASRLASDQGRLAELRSSMRDRMKRSPLMDGKQFARHVEEACRTIWRQWCKRPPSS